MKSYPVMYVAEAGITPGSAGAIAVGVRVGRHAVISSCDSTSRPTARSGTYRRRLNHAIGSRSPYGSSVRKWRVPSASVSGVVWPPLPASSSLAYSASLPVRVMSTRAMGTMSTSTITRWRRPGRVSRI